MFKKLDLHETKWRMKMTPNTVSMTRENRFPNNSLTKLTLVTALIFLSSPAIIVNAATENTSYLKSVAITDAAGTNAPPTAVINYSNKGDMFTFDASQSSDSDGSIASYKWNFGGSLAEGVKTSHQITANPTPVTLTILDDKGGVAITQKAISTSFEIIVDNSDPQFSKTGTWRTSTGTPGYLGDNYFYTNKKDGAAIAKWNVEIPVAGKYEIFCHYSSEPVYRSDKAAYTVNSNGTDLGKIIINQKVNGGVFNSLGVYNLAMGPLNVLLAGDTVGDVVADAVKIVYKP
jgi:hypothetical protein